MWASLFHLIAVFVAVHITKCQPVCNKQAPLEWYLKKHTIQLNWTLIGNICENDLECWGSQGKRQVSEQPFSFPQICPLQLQHGDKLLMSADETLKTYGIRVFNVSREDFESCTTNAELKNQFVFPHNTNESEHVEAKWITPGHHYFIALREGDSQLCKLGLRLNVSVKTQLCRASPLLRLCSGNGVCRTDFYEGAYHCRCNHRYFGRFCERFDACLDNPCQNKGICLSNGSTDPNNRTYKCLCPPHFTGVNCSEIIGEGNCQTICEDGTCVQLSPVSFKCICASGFSGKRLYFLLKFDILQMH
uniref:Eyes shut homolog n=1 Tax=Poecilia formosa TaxID=48698 RepID=A0A087Y1F8_POEFO